MWPSYGEFSFIHPGDLNQISMPLDFLGVNYYYPTTVAEGNYDAQDPAERTAFDIGIQQVLDPSFETTEMGWPVDASGLGDLLNWIMQTYPGRVPAIEITENGRACADVVADGRVDDPERIRYVADHRGSRRQRRSGAGVLLLVAAGSLRMGRGIRQTIRARVHRLLNSGSDPEDERLLVPGSHPSPSGSASALLAAN